MRRAAVAVAVLSLAQCLSIGAAAAGKVAPAVSSDRLWTAAAAPTASARTVGARAAPRVSRSFRLNEPAAKQALARAPMERTAAARAGKRTMTVPTPEGAFLSLRIEQAPILAPALQRRFPGTRTYRARGVQDPTVTARLDFTRAGFHAQVITDKGTFYVDPTATGGQRVYRSYWKSDLPARSFTCGVETPLAEGLFDLALSPTFPSGTDLRTYRLAVTATGEYASFLGGRTAAENQIQTTMNRVAGIYEREVAIRFTVVAMNVYTDPATDPFPTGNIVNGELLDQNRDDLDAKVGSGNYDIGHILSQGSGGGLAGIGVTCGPDKGRGGTSLGTPSGDGFDVDYVAHEMGHQMGGLHTFNGTTDSCGNAGQRSAATAFEPGSGTTIMAYAGICGAENVQPHSDDYLHSVSFEQITTFRNGAGACGTLISNGNTVPIVDAGADYTIPRETPFALTAAGSDFDGDALTFCWEQIDAGAAPPPQNMADGPLFRSRPPTSEPTRVFPPLADLLSGAPTPWERLATVDRALNFRVTARDNHPGQGGVDYDSMVVTVAGEPFLVTAPASGATLECGGGETLAWSVGGGAVAADVRARISINAGATFADVLASTPNDGSEPFTVPAALTGDARILLEGLGNIFFNLSGPFSIADTQAPEIASPPPVTAECTEPAGSPVAALGTPVASDVCDPTLLVTNDAPALFPLATTTVTWTARDDSGNFDTATQSVTVRDTTAPLITAPADLKAECSGPAGTPVAALGTPVASDLCDTTLLVTNDAPALFPLAATTVTWTAQDDSDNSSTDVQVVTILDATAPRITLTVSPTELWPPNHKMATIRASIAVSDVCDAAPAVRLVSIASNEPDNGLGDGDTVDDITGAAFGQDDREFQLRAERSGKGGGRVYTITYEVRDASGNASLAKATVKVPKSQGTKAVASAP